MQIRQLMGLLGGSATLVGIVIRNALSLSGLYRVDIGKPNSGSRHNAISLLSTADIALSDLQAIHETGLQRGLEMLAADEIDAVIATIGAPAKAVQRAAVGGSIRLLALSEEERAALEQEGSAYVRVNLPPSTYPGQLEAVPTVAVTATLVATAGLPQGDVERTLTALFRGIDFIRAGSAAGSRIDESTAQLALTIPMHPAAIAFFGQPETQTPAAEPSEASTKDVEESDR